MCKTADYDVKKDCNMYAIHIIKNDKLRNNVLSRIAHVH